MAKPKYSLKQNWLWLIIICPVKTETEYSRPFWYERTSVRRWVRAWQFHGAEGLTAKNNHYSDEFKLVVVRGYQ
jgi:hypothetical protein